VTAVSLVRAGIGYAIVPQLALDTIDDGELVAVPLRSPSVTRTLGIITRKTVPLRPTARDLLSLLSQALKRSVAARQDESK
jgi:DNA-binding transcriptional LysR family regulator